MCGIAGLLEPGRSRLGNLHGRVSAMTSRLRHRGPDADGIWTDENVALGHRRLAIVDLSEAGAQPMLSADGRYVIAYNGEIYNHSELRREIEQTGAAPAWRGHSDTETLLAAIVHWGLDDCLKRTAGMFAIALWDRRERRLSLARDRLGEKPLYWGWAGGALVFGSELKALRAHPGFASDICREALAQYLRFAYIPSPRCIYPGVYKLEPGCILDVSEEAPAAPPSQPLRPGERHGSISIRRYWFLNDVIDSGRSKEFASEPEALQALERVMDEAVSRQMVADVPLGAFLSGGIDSSLIVALMQARSSRPVRTFTIGFENPTFNEAPHAAAVARHLGTDHTELMVTEKEARDVIPILPDLYDEPFADSSQVPTHLVCRAARREVTVALSGDGGDELFGGYNRYFWGPRIWQKLAWLPYPVRKMLGAGIAALPVSAWDGAGTLIAKIGGPSVSAAGDKAHRLAHRLSDVRTMDQLYLSLVSLNTDPSATAPSVKEPTSQLDDPLPLGLDPAQRMMVQDLRSYLPDDIMCKVDRAAMGVSLETRAPFLDHDVVALAARIPIHMKIRDNQGKWALRQILYKHVPRELVERPKAGFAIPIGDWLRGPLRHWAADLLSPEMLARDGLLNAPAVTQMWGEHLSGRRDWTNRLWVVLMLQAWRSKIG